MAHPNARPGSSLSLSSENFDKQVSELTRGNIISTSKGVEEDTSSNENVRVMVRCRPLLGAAERAKSQQERVAVNVDEVKCCVNVDDRQFYFDQAFGPESTNDELYVKSTHQLVESAFNGYNCTIFLYGQTGTGKTYTHSSLTLNAFAHLFGLIRHSNTQARFLIYASYYELYNEEIRDLLSNSNKSLELRESKARGIHVKDLTCFLVDNYNELERLKRVGDKKRATAATKMNEHSSRSHSIFTVSIERISTEGDQANRNSSANNLTQSNKKKSTFSGSDNSRANTAQVVRRGRLNLIDLAGSERQAKSGSTGARLKEASLINLSLTCLSLVIRALTDKTSNHIPYRNSKLTRLLSSSLGGNSKTLLIACVSPARLHLDETLNTLRFASRTKRIKNKAEINEDPKDALLRKYRQQINELKQMLNEQQRVSTNEDDDAIESLQWRNAQEAALDATRETDGASLLTDGGDGDKQLSANEQLLQQLKLLKAKIMFGGENLLEKAETHERMLEASRKELEKKRLAEAKLKLELEKKRQIIDQVAQSKDNLEVQQADFNEKLKRALVLYRRSKDELKDLTSEHEQLKASLLQQIRATSKEIKYADCVIEDFIPRESLDLINACAQYDEDSCEWQIKYVALSGNNIAQTKRLAEGQIVDIKQTRSFATSIVSG